MYIVYIVCVYIYIMYVCIDIYILFVTYIMMCIDNVYVHIYIYMYIYVYIYTYTYGISTAWDIERMDSGC